MRAGDARHVFQLLHELGTDRLALGAGIIGGVEAGDDVVGDDGAEQLLAHPARGPGRRDRADADQELHARCEAEVDQALAVAAHDVDIHAELRLHELHSGFGLGDEPFRLPVRGWVDRRVRRPEQHLCRAVDFGAGRQRALVAHALGHGEQRGGVVVEDGLRIRLVAGRRIVAAQHQEAGQAQRQRSKQIGLQGQAVPVAAGHLHDRLDAAGLEDLRGGDRRQRGLRAGAVGDVHRRRLAAQGQGTLQQCFGIGGDRRRHLCGDDELAGLEPLSQHAHREIDVSTSRPSR